MHRVLLLFVWLISSSVVKMNTATPVFGVRVSIGANSQINTFVCFLNNGRVLTKKKIFDKESFIKIISGYWPSIYNPHRINYFEENNIGCGVEIDSITTKPISLCNPFDSLWKIRFSTYPFQHNTEMGWSNKMHKPSSKQEIYLYDRYNVGYVDADFFLDTNFWRILRDVEDTAWIDNYKSLR